MKKIILLLILIIIVGSTGLFASDDRRVSTYSIVAFDPITGDLGVAVQSKFLGVGPVVPWVKAGVGAIATQAWANTTYGPKGLKLLEEGISAGEAGRLLVEEDENASHRQVGIVDAEGRVWAWTGEDCLDWAGHIKGEHFTVQGNILESEAVVTEMAAAFRETEGDLAIRLLAALEAGERAGGDRRGSQSSALMVYREKGGYAGFNDRFIDLRVEDHDDPVGELKRLFLMWEEFLGYDARARTARMFSERGMETAAQREKKRVIAIVERMIENDPENVQMLIRLGWTLTMQEISVNHGLQLAQKAVLLSPQNRNALYLLGESYYKIGEVEEAIETFIYAREKFPDDKEIQTRLEELKKN